MQYFYITQCLLCKLLDAKGFCEGREYIAVMCWIVLKKLVINYFPGAFAGTVMSVVSVWNSVEKVGGPHALNLKS